MKELINLVVSIMILFGVGTSLANKIHDEIRKAALERVSKGLPSLTKLTTSLRSSKKK